MSALLASLRELSDRDLTARMYACVAAERVATAQLIATLGEFDVRRLYLSEGFGSLFDYCTRHLHLSERAAGTRIAAARLARRFPLVIDLIADSRVSLTVIGLLARHRNEANYRAVLEEATHKTVSEAEVMIAHLSPQPDAKAMVRRVAGPLPAGAASRGLEAVELRPPSAPQAPAPVPAQPCAAPVPQPFPPSRSVVKPLSPDRYKVQFTISEETRDKLRTVQDLLGHSVPPGDLGDVFDRALTALLGEIERQKLAVVARPQRRRRPVKPGTRLIPAEVRRQVWRRDKGRCAFVGTQGRCRERSRLELHHVRPFAAGGAATAENIQLRCRAHNAHEADLFLMSARD